MDGTYLNKRACRSSSRLWRDVATWASRGETPVRMHAFSGKKLALGAALAYRWEGKRFRLYFQTRPHNYHAASRRAFLPDRRRPRRGPRATLIGNGRPAHKSRIMPDSLFDRIVTVLCEVQ